MKKSKLYRIAKYIWYRFYLRNIYFWVREKSASCKLLPNPQVSSFYKNILFFHRYMKPNAELQKLVDSPPEAENLTIEMSVPPGYVAINYDKIKSLSGVGVKYYEAGALQLQKYVSRTKIGVPLTAGPSSGFWLSRSLDPNARELKHATNHFTFCLGIPRVVNESFALQVLHLFECFLVIRKLQLQNQEVECLLLDCDRDKFSELYTTCLPGCHFPQERAGVHLFNHFKTLRYSMGGGNSQWRKKIYKCAPVDEFHRFVLSAFGIATPKPTTRVKRLTLIRRKQYTEESGKPCIDRVIKNEEEIIANLKNKYQELEVRAIYFEELSIAEQLRQFTQTDVLIGMHGAGIIVGAYFMPPNAGVLELFPKYFRSPNSAITCRAIATRRQLRYRRWLNHRKRNEFGTDIRADFKKRYYRSPVRYASLTQVPTTALTRALDPLIRQIESGYPRAPIT